MLVSFRLINTLVNFQFYIYSMIKFFIDNIIIIYLNDLLTFVRTLFQPQKHV